MKAHLLTKQSQHVCFLELPFFMTPPQVLQWGDRTFVLDDRPFVESEHGHTYYEEFTMAVLPEMIVETECDMSHSEGEK